MKKHIYMLKITLEATNNSVQICTSKIRLTRLEKKNDGITRA